jgi:hypothetical protein
VLDPKTERKIRECFAGRSCCECGRPAVRLDHGRFYCDRHYPYEVTADGAPRVYRHRPPGRTC